MKSETGNGTVVAKSSQHQQHAQLSHEMAVRAMESSSEKPQLKCLYCNKVQKSPARLACHLRVHTGDKPFKCNYCTTSFTEYGSQLKHERKFHNVGVARVRNKMKSGQAIIKARNPARQECMDESSNWTDEDHMRQSVVAKHTRIHTGEKPYKCKFCDKAFSNRGSLYKHEASCHNSDGGALGPANGSQKMSHSAELYSQKSSVSVGQNPSMSASQKFVTTNQKSFMSTRPKSSVSAVLGSVKPAISLQIAKEAKRNAQSTSVDISSSSDDGNSTDLDSSDESSVYLSESPMQHDNKLMEGQMLKCPHCTKRFSSSYFLRRHLYVHTGEKPYKCNACAKAYRQPYRLRNHMIRCHEPTVQERRNTCMFCTKVFHSSAILLKHLRVHGCNTGPYRCSICDAEFNKIYQLNKHVQRYHLDVESMSLGSNQVRGVSRNSWNSNLSRSTVADITDADQSCDDVQGSEAEQLYWSVEADQVAAASTEEAELLNGYHDNESSGVDVSQTDLDRDSNAHQLAAGIEKAGPGNGFHGYESGRDDTDDDGNGHDGRNDVSRDYMPVKRCYVALHRLWQKSAAAPETVERKYAKTAAVFEEETGRERCATSRQLAAAGSHVEESSGGRANGSGFNDRDKPYRCSLCPCSFVRANGLFRHRWRYHNGAGSNSCKTPARENAQNVASGRSRQADRLELGRVEASSASNALTIEPDKKIATSGRGVCDGDGSDKTSRRRKDVIGKKGKYRCTYCNKTEKTQLLLTAHICTRSNDRPFQCDRCDESFKQYSGLSTHRRRHHKLPIGSLTPHQQQRCLSGKRTSSVAGDDDNVLTPDKQPRTQMFGAIQRQGFSKGLRYKCTYCGKMFLYPYELKRHMYVHTGEMPFKCDRCECQYRKICELRTHQQRYHPDVDNSSIDKKNGLKNENTDAVLSNSTVTESLEPDQQAYSMQETNKKTVRRRVLTLNRFSGVDAGRKKGFSKGLRYKCTYCGKMYLWPYELRRHMYVHTGELPFRCDKCKCQYHQRCELLSHQKLSHPDVENSSKDKTIGLKREETSVTSSNSTALEGQECSHYSDSVQEASKKTVRKRAMAFSRSSSARRRKQTFYKCTYCEKKYPYPCELKRHMYIHTGELPYRCDKCVCQYSKRCELLSHQKLSHPDGENSSSDKFSQEREEADTVLSHSTAAEIGEPSQSDNAQAGEKLIRKAALKRHRFGSDVGSACEKDFSKGLRYKCTYCGKMYPWPYELKRHMYVHTGELPFRCDQCECQYRKRCELLSHQKLSHPNVEISSNDEKIGQKKEKSYAVSSTSTAPESEKHGHRTDNVQATDGKLIRKAALKVYRFGSGSGAGKKKGFSKGRRYKCTYCGKTYPWPYELKRHMYVHTGELPFRCDQCECQYRKRCELLSHQKLSHPNVEISSNDKIGLKRKAKDDQQNTVLSHSAVAESGEPSQSDSIQATDGKLIRKAALKVYRFGSGSGAGKKKGFSKGRRYKCTYCGKTYPWPYELKRHMYIHTGELPFRCDQCECQYRKRCELLSHQKLSHPNVENSSKIVRKREEADTVLSHSAVAGSGEPSQSDSIQASDANSIRRGALKLSKTTGARGRKLVFSKGLRYKCTYCGKMYPWQYELKRHMYVHTGELPFRCDKCACQYRKRCELLSHEKLSHPDGENSSSGQKTGAKKEKTDALPSKSTVAGKVIQEQESDSVLETVRTSVRRGAWKLKKPGRKEGFSKGLRYKCMYCEKMYPWPYELKRHMYVHTGERPFKCDKCGLQFCRSGDLRLHKQHCLPVSDDKSYSECDQSRDGLSLSVNAFPSYTIDAQGVQQQLEDSVRDQRASNVDADWFDTSVDVKPNLVEIDPTGAGGVSGTEQQLQQVAADDEDEELCQYSCLYCTGLFDSQSELFHHASVEHGFEIIPNTEYVQSELSGTEDIDSNVHLVSAVIRSPSKECPKEPVEPPRQVSVSNHKRQLQCVYCDKRFNYQSLLTRHLCVHTGEKPYHCESCGKSFTESSNLRKHRQRCKGKTTAVSDRPLAQNESSSEAQSSVNEQGYHCQYCGKVFATSYPYRRHMLVHTGERPFKCTLCDAAFRDRYRLRSHRERFHENKVPTGRRYKCATCTMAFWSPTHLAKHIQIHTGTKPYKCDVCGLEFVNLSKLHRHARICQGDVEVPSNHFQNAGNVVRPATSDKASNVAAGVTKDHQHNEGVTAPAASSSEESTATHCDGSSSATLFPMDAKLYPCMLCTMRFEDLYRLKKHLLVHTDDDDDEMTSYSCDLCFTTFSEPSELRQHEQCCPLR